MVGAAKALARVPDRVPCRALLAEEQEGEPEGGGGAA
jgi:hypothetical protein